MPVSRLRRFIVRFVVLLVLLKTRAEASIGRPVECTFSTNAPLGLCVGEGINSVR